MEDRAFLIMVDYDGKESTFFIDSSLAFSLAKEEAQQALVCIGSERYRYIDGEPVFGFVTDKAS